MRSREQELRDYTIKQFGLIILAVLVGLLVGIVIARSHQSVLIEEERTPCFTYTNLEEIEDIKPAEEPAKPTYNVIIDDGEVEALAKMVWGETHGILTKTEMSACVWVVCNRAEAWNMTITEVLEQPGQFTGYRCGNPATDELKTLVIDVLTRWQIEQQGADAYTVCRTIPKAYLWWNGDGNHNYFRNAFDGYYTIWDWSLPNPYGD